MRRTARGAQSRRGLRVRSATLVACGLAGLALPALANAEPPAQDEYVLPAPSATGSGKGSHTGAGSDDGGAGAGGAVSGVPASSRDRSDDGALPVLLGGLAVIGAAAAVIAYRRRRGGSGKPS